MCGVRRGNGNIGRVTGRPGSADPGDRPFLDRHVWLPLEAICAGLPNQSENCCTVLNASAQFYRRE